MTLKQIDAYVNHIPPDVATMFYGTQKQKAQAMPASRIEIMSLCQAFGIKPPRRF